jgi:hypothetical protein
VSRSHTSFPSRRQFGRAVAALAAAPLTMPRVAAADPPRTAADAMSEVIRLRHGKHLSDEQLKQVERGIQLSLRQGETLKRFPLKNSDEPAFAFTADV